MKRTSSLAFRLTASAAAVSLVLLIVAGLLLGKLFQDAVERNFDARLQSVLDGLLGSVDIGADNQVVLSGTIADSRFKLPLSGWYWQITPIDGTPAEGLKSESLLEQRLNPQAAQLADRDANNIAHFYISDVKGTRLRAIGTEYTLFDAGRYSLLVAGNFDELKTEIAAFQGALFIVLGVLGIGLLISILLQVRYGLTPLRTLENELAGIRQGRRELLSEAYPSEIAPVADELNLLIQSNAEIVDRARTQVGNLAHALKTPLSVLANEARLSNSDLAAKLGAQIGIMRNQVSLYLDRARRAARAQTLGSSTNVRETLDALARTLMRIHMERGINISVDCQPGVKFRGERQDLEEMVGNLVDNASKWANRTVRIDVRPPTVDPVDGRSWLEIRVGDDGPGLPADKLHDALKRGHRLDETKPGSGLGLSIVSETAAMYNGTVTLGKSELGGLLARVRLPAVQGK
jgi:signal transduction histidine kinase